MKKVNKSASQIIDDIILLEGEYVNHINDLGGPTKYGVTLETARSHGYQGSIEALPKMTAKLIYMQKYWLLPGFNKINLLSQDLAIKLFDAGVNVGTSRCVSWLQRGLNLFTSHKLKIDGQLGNKTLGALNDFLDKRAHMDGVSTLIKVINVFQGAHYINIAEKKNSQRSFIYGWIRNRID